MLGPRGRCLLALGVLATGVLALSTPADASPLDLFGFGGRSPALAGAGIASARDYDAVYLDPAGLAEVPHKRITLGMLYGDFALELDGQATATDPAVGLLLGGALPMPLGGALRDRVGLGFGFYVPTRTLNRARHPVPGTPIFILLENRSHVIAIQVAAGLKLNDRLSVGAGVIALAALHGSIDVTTDVTGRFATTSEQQLLTQVAPVLGGRWHTSATLTLGLTARGESRSDYDIAVATDIGDVVPIRLPPIRIAGTAQYDPLTVAAEAAWRPRPDLELSAQLGWQRWSAYPLPTQNPVSGTPPQQLPDFHDTAVPRLAAEWSRGVVAIRGGYAFLWSPAPEQTGQQSLLDNHRHLFALGAGLAVGSLHLDAWAQAHILQGRRHVKDTVGLDEPPPFAAISTRGHILVGGLTVGVDL